MPEEYLSQLMPWVIEAKQREAAEELAYQQHIN